MGKCDHEEEKDKCIPYQLQRLFLQLQTTKEKSIATIDLTKCFGWDSKEGKKANVITVVASPGAKSDIATIINFLRTIRAYLYFTATYVIVNM